MTKNQLISKLNREIAHYNEILKRTHQDTTPLAAKLLELEDLLWEDPTNAELKAQYADLSIDYDDLMRYEGKVYSAIARAEQKLDEINRGIYRAVINLKE